MKTIKTAVSLPADLYEKVEKLRKLLGKSRSRMFAEALAKGVREIEIKDKEARDDAAYLKNPYTKKELAEAATANAQAWAHIDEADKNVNWEEYFAPKRDMDR